MGSTSSPRFSSWRHRKSWFAFTPWARATCATLAPGSNVSSANRQVIFDEDADGWLDAYSVDHGHLFGGPMADLKRHFRASCYLDRWIYGQVPSEALLDFQNVLHALDADRLRQRIEAIPAEWSHASARESRDFFAGARVLRTEPA
jgi:hypothetical protein